MKASKLVVLVGGILGILAFFLPLGQRRHVEGNTASVSAFQVVKGLDASRGAVTIGEVAATRDERRRRA